MDPFSAIGVIAGALTIVELIREVTTFVQAGRIWEKTITGLSTEKLLHQDYLHYVLHDLQTPSVDLCWNNGSIRSGMEMRFGYDKAHHLIKLLEKNENTIQALNSALALYEGWDKELQSLLLEVPQASESLVLSRLIERFQGVLVELRENKCAFEERPAVLLQELKKTNKSVCCLLQLESATIPLGGSSGLYQQLKWFPPSVQQYLFININTIHPESFHPIQNPYRYLGRNQITELPSSSTSLILPQHIPFHRTPPPRRLSTWKILLLSMRPHKAFFLIQLLVLLLSATIGITWAIVKDDIGTATGLAGIVFALGSTANSSYDKCYRGDRGMRIPVGREGVHGPEEIEMDGFLLKED